jgi:hypothetical protein
VAFLFFTPAHGGGKRRDFNYFETRPFSREAAVEKDI